MGAQNRHIVPFLESASLKKRKRKSMSSDTKKKKTAEMSKKWNINIYRLYVRKKNHAIIVITDL